MFRMICAGVAALVFLPAWAQAASGQATGEDMIEVSPVSVTAGGQASRGDCPCFRWTVEVDAGAGRIETQDLILTSDALFKLVQRYTMVEDELSARLVTVGAIQALWKGGHIGLGFTGLTVGNDPDRSYSDIVRTGLYVIANLFASDSARLDIHSGYEFEQKRTNSGPLTDTHRLPTSVVYDWRAGGWSGDVSAEVAVDVQHPEWNTVRATGGASIERRIFGLGDLVGALGLGLSGGWDGSRAEYHLTQWDFTAGLYMKLAWVMGGGH